MGPEVKEIENFFEERITDLIKTWQMEDKSQTPAAPTCITIDNEGYVNEWLHNIVINVQENTSLCTTEVSESSDCPNGFINMMFVYYR